VNTVRNIVLAAAAVAAMVVVAPGTAGADPTPPPSPGYQIPGASGPVLPGVQVYPPRCLAQPLACGLHYDPSTGTWNPSDPGGV
jgi:hypothetical protein